MNRIIRQKLGNSKRRLVNKLNEISIALREAEGGALSKYDATKFLMEIEKKVEMFQTHVDELEAAVANDNDELERYLKDYQEYEEVLNESENLGTKLNFLVKYEDERRVEELRKIEVEKSRLEKMKLETSMNQTESTPEVASPVPGKSINIRLPKLELVKYDGNILKGQEFWDCYESMIHNNTSLQPIDKFNYLKVQLIGEAKEVISGLDITNINYDVAIKLLLERYGRRHLQIDAHYAQLRDIMCATDEYNKLRVMYDNIEKHLRSLESLGENVKNNMVVSLVKSKLPKIVMSRLEEYKDEGTPWNLDVLRKCLKKYVDAQEAGEQQRNLQTTSSYDRDQSAGSINKKMYNGRIATGVIYVGSNNRSCIYCQQVDHWSDECKAYPDVDSRREKLGSCCDICFNRSHKIEDCKVNRFCFHCKEKNSHHRSLCPVKFIKKSNSNNGDSLNCAAINTNGEKTVIMQTARVMVKNGDDDRIGDQCTRLLLDCGSQRTYVSRYITEKLQLTSIGKNYLMVYTFGSSKPENIETDVVEFGLLLKSGFMMKIQANVVSLAAKSHISANWSNQYA